MAEGKPVNPLFAIQTKAERRVDSAVRRANEFSKAVRDWGASNPATLVPSIADDRLSWAAILDFNAEPDLDAWNHTFGEVVHHLRSALNNLLAGIGAAEGLDQKAIGRLQFPTVLDASQWEASRWRVSDLPSRVESAIREIQPFRREPHEGRSASGDPLAILNNLSNQDKHRLELEPSINLATLSHDYQVQFREVPDSGVLQEVMNRMVLDPSFTKGAVVISHDTSPYHIDRILGRTDWQGHLTLTTDSGQTYRPGQTLTILVPYVLDVIHHILGAWGGPAASGK